MSAIGATQATLSTQPPTPALGPSAAAGVMGGIFGAIVGMVALHLSVVVAVGIGAVVGAAAFFLPRVVASARYVPKTWELGEKGVVQRAPDGEKTLLFDDYQLHYWKVIEVIQGVQHPYEHTYLVAKRGGERAVYFDDASAAKAVRAAHERHRLARLREEVSPRFQCLAQLDKTSIPTELGAFVVHDDAVEISSGDKRFRVPFADLRVDVKDGQLMAAWKTDSMRIPVALVADVNVLLGLLERRA